MAPKTPNITSDANTALLHYDTIFAVDTNTRTIGQRTVSATGILLANWSNRDTGQLKYARGECFEFWDADCHPDLLALKLHMQLLERNPTLMKAGKIAYIIDSHLGDLGALASRQTPILDDFYLPEWATLLYASDATKDSIVNALLRAADTTADSLLRHIGAGQNLQAQPPH